MRPLVLIAGVVSSSPELLEPLLQDVLELSKNASWEQLGVFEMVVLENGCGTGK